MTVSKLKDSKGFTLGHNFDACTLPLFDRVPGSDEFLGMNVTHYLPSGGSKLCMQPVEAIFYVMEGEMTVVLETGDIILSKGEAVHFSRGESKGLKNHTNCPATMLVAAIMSDRPENVPE